VNIFVPTKRDVGSSELKHYTGHVQAIDAPVSSSVGVPTPLEPSSGGQASAASNAAAVAPRFFPAWKCATVAIEGAGLSQAAAAATTASTSDGKTAAPAVAGSSPSSRGPAEMVHWNISADICVLLQYPYCLNILYWNILTG
jgi:hypothetical protein